MQQWWTTVVEWKCYRLPQPGVSFHAIPDGASEVLRYRNKRESGPKKKRWKKSKSISAAFAVCSSGKHVPTVAAVAVCANSCENSRNGWCLCHNSSRDTVRKCEKGGINYHDTTINCSTSWLLATSTTTTTTTTSTRHTRSHGRHARGYRSDWGPQQQQQRSQQRTVTEQRSNANAGPLGSGAY